ncbi:hypothetical protein HRR83_004552 [Exophiala dermatitidis]|uniref:Arylsulfotransferase n=2 Tax=Exophiala dermatitidis TaxID=5970 RepID=H6BR50_EXODN|nr:uncharacterized protein HMPREF1120_02090 [Exophiala dermatitidis NIH/UT8656]KAJ4515736.1 hypothetical protein HRR75_003817 [Exophiala dermatitidis]EHY53910.1 hypothetical protein HMPREF1120_02090 [Exophiala dermatitidis NIH/UT8656]KAJ4519423.1 hypothetical protein HRR74_004166 [Exophiala dermatitidis]KAJ4529239.1 hypothetical protein HRR73_000261 [Exophiala dermatitidis]KAJ4544110.1 hypothetical protein HRR76_002180 [Exophiala dermatitidis]
MRTSLHLVVYCWLICLFSWRTVADNKSQPISIFRSRPDLQAPILTVLTSVPEKVAPGYYFVAPYQQAQETIHIYDNEANLIYSGFGSAGPGIIHAPQTCMYQGEVHLCFYQGTQMVGWGHGHGVIMDKHYRVVKSVEPASYQASSDMHEFRLIDDGRSALMTQYLRSVYDLCPWNLCDGLGYIQQGAFQEIDVETGELLFEWQSLDHVDPNESYVGPGTTEISGSGQQPDSPWDYFHINSIDKNEQGDYLISARHVSAVYKISGVDGHVMWRLNGAKSDYYLDGFSFSFQHDARFVSDNVTHTVISLFDNGSNGFNQTQPHSTGQIISLDHRTKVATCLLKLDPPPVVEGKVGGGHISKSQGNMQRLPNGNFLLGWGNDAFWTEYAATDDHEVVFYGTLGWTNLMNYRVHKFDNWVGRPLTKPALWTYSKHGDNATTEKMTLYVSWNGATEVKAWRFFGSDDDKMDRDLKHGRIWAMLSTDPVPKSGFETVYFYPQMYRFTYAEALDKDGNVLGTSAVAKTYVPNHQMQEHCDDLACRFMPTQEEREQYAAQQREKEEQEKLNRQERTRLRARVKKSVELYAGTFGLLAFFTVLLVLLVTRNFVSRPLYFVVHRVGSLARKIIDRRDDGIGLRGNSLPRYKALSRDDHEADHEHGND